MSNDLHGGTQGQAGSGRGEYVGRFREMDTRASTRIGFDEILAYCKPWLVGGATEAGASRQEDGQAQQASEAERGRKAGSAGRGGAEEKGKQWGSRAGEGGGDDQEAGKLAAGSSHALLAQLVRSGKGEVHSSTRTHAHARTHRHTHTDIADAHIRWHVCARTHAQEAAYRVLDSSVKLRDWHPPLAWRASVYTAREVEVFSSGREHAGSPIRPGSVCLFGSLSCALACSLCACRKSVWCLHSSR